MAASNPSVYSNKARLVIKRMK